MKNVLLMLMAVPMIMLFAPNANALSLEQRKQYKQ